MEDKEETSYVQELVWQQTCSPRGQRPECNIDRSEICGVQNLAFDDEENRCHGMRDVRRYISFEDIQNNGSSVSVSRCLLNLGSQSSKSWKTGKKASTLEKENSLLAGSPAKSGHNGGSSLDRFIPNRDSEDWDMKFTIMTGRFVTGTPNKKKDALVGGDGSANGGHIFQRLLQNELLGDASSALPEKPSSTSPTTPQYKSGGSQPNRATFGSGRSPKVNLFNYKRKVEWVDNPEATASAYTLSPVGLKSQKLLDSPRKPPRKIPRIPFKVLDAPELQDDFYLNLVDWSSQNVLAVGLGNSVYLWSASTSQVTRLCDFLTDNNTVTSVSWNERGNYVAVGTQLGYVQIWDVVANKLVTKLTCHNARVGVLAWNNEILCSGSRDRLIFQKDIRGDPSFPDRRLVGHRQEICGLKWSPDNQYLASGGNDNRLFVWNQRSMMPIQTYSEHMAAVKAIAWSPHQHGLLASGGGTADRCIRFWNTLTGQAMQWVDTGSQVCNLAWSKHSSELVSTHGYSQNQILVWKYPSLTQVAKLTGHSYRVLYLAMSPDGESIVTGAGDETLRFWNIFSKSSSQKECRGHLNLYSHIR